MANGIDIRPRLQSRPELMQRIAQLRAQRRSPTVASDLSSAFKGAAEGLQISESIRGIINRRKRAQELGKLFQPQTEEVVSGGTTQKVTRPPLVDPRMEPLVSGAAEQNPAVALQQVNQMIEQRAKQTGVKPALDAKTVATIENNLRDDFLKQSSDFIKVRDSFNRVEASVNNPTAAGDLALIFNYMKMLDPGSVVRESEFANAAATGSLGARWVGLGKKLMSGERLADSVRNDFKNRAKRLFSQQNAQFNQVSNEFRRLARNIPGISEDNVVINIKKVKTIFDSIEEAEKANLPKGTFITVNGREAVVE